MDSLHLLLLAAALSPIELIVLPRSRGLEQRVVAMCCLILGTILGFVAYLVASERGLPHPLAVLAGGLGYLALPLGARWLVSAAHTEPATVVGGRTRGQLPCVAMEASGDKLVVDECQVAPEDCADGDPVLVLVEVSVLTGYRLRTTLLDRCPATAAA